MHELKREANVNRAAAGTPAYEKGPIRNALDRFLVREYDGSPEAQAVGRFAGIDTE
jgi:hypothetical protein